MERILIADDDQSIAALIADNLQLEGFETVIMHSGDAALSALQSGDRFDLVLLDIMMPGADGLQVLRQVRDKLKGPILLVTAKSRTTDAIVGLEMGADDYIRKPFSVEELIAKVKAHIRRDKRQEKSSFDAVTFGELTIYRESYEVTLAGDPVTLTTREFQLLCYLYDNRGKVLTREQIFDAVWGMEYFDLGSVTVTIKALRDKLDPESRYIKTVWGVGYKFVSGGII
jgi:DNA-binding response OmpR family regulator